MTRNRFINTFFDKVMLVISILLLLALFCIIIYFAYTAYHAIPKALPGIIV